MRKYFDIDKLAYEYNVDVVDMKTPDGGTMKRHAWKHSELPKAVSAARVAAAEGQSLCFKGGAMSWLLGPVTVHLAPVLEEFEFRGEVWSVITLPMGEPNARGEIEFEVHEVEDRTYVSYQCDKPDEPFPDGPHNYDVSKLQYAVVPELKQGTNLYLSTQGYFYVLTVLLKSWFDCCNSIWIWDAEEKVYICGYAKNEAMLYHTKKATY